MNYIQDILTGLLFGITSGISPGPLLVLLISETIKGNKKNGILVSISPIITDIPVFILSLFFLKRIDRIYNCLNIIYFLGGLILIYYGLKHLRENGITFSKEDHGALKRAIVLNLLSPYTYIFWFFIGTPYFQSRDTVEGVLFLFLFFTGMTGSMLIITIFTEKIKKFMESKYYIYFLKLIGIIFILFGFHFIKISIEKSYQDHFISTPSNHA